MATIYWRGKGEQKAAYLQWFERGSQQRESLGRITPAEAEKFRKEKEFELRTGRKIFTASTLFEDHLLKYVDWHALRWRSGHFRVKQICEQCFTDFYGRPLTVITQKDIEDWLTRRMERTFIAGKGRKRRTVTATTVAKELTTLKAVFNKAVEWEKGFISPAAAIAKPKALNSKPPHWYRRDELALLFKDTPYAPIWRLMANTGMRRAEAMHQRWEDVDWERGVINVVSTEEDRTKSGKWREIPLSAGAVVALKELKLQTGSLPEVLPQMALTSLSRCFAVDAKARKLKGQLHSLRHSYAAHLVLDNVPLRKVQTLMGHQHFSTTEKYGHIGADQLVERVKAVSL